MTGVDLTYWTLMGGRLAVNPPSLSHSGDDRASSRTHAAVRPPALEDTPGHWEYLVKWRDRSHIHCEWILEEEVEADYPPEGRKRLMVRMSLLFAVL